MRKFLDRLLFVVIGVPLIILWALSHGKSKTKIDQQLVVNCLAGYGLAHIIIQVIKWGYRLYHGWN